MSMLHITNSNMCFGKKVSFAKSLDSSQAKETVLVTQEQEAKKVTQNQETEVAIKPRSWTGYVFACLSSVTTAVGALLIKLSEGEKVQIVFFRCILQYIILLPIITKQKTDVLTESWKKLLLLLFRGIAGPITMSTFAASMNYLSLGNAMAIFYMYPAWVTLFAAICLKEKCGVLNVVLTAVAMVGFLFVAEPTFIFGQASAATEENEHSATDLIIGLSLSLCASVLCALVCVVLRKLGSAVHYTLSSFYYAWEGAIFLTVYLVASGKQAEPCLHSLPIMIAAGLIYFLGQILKTLALQRERAGPITLIQTSEVIYAFLLQYLVLGVVPSLFGGIGAALILLSCVVMAVKNIRKALKTS